jgi:hypothetical protein
MRKIFFPIMATGMLLAAGRANAQTALNVPLHGQETPDWCYAATTQMIGEYFGSTIKQCTISSYDNGGLDCCPAAGQPVPAACVNGGNTFDELTYWGFPGTLNSGPLSYAGIKSEIAAQRPIAVGIEWPSGGHHAIVVDGYWTKSDGTQHVHILNPLPVNVGDEEWATYNVLLNGGTEDSGTHLGTHTVSTMSYQLHWQAICPMDFDNLDSSNYQQCWDQRVHHNQWPASLSSGDSKMAGNWRGSGNRPVSWNNSLADLKSRANSLSASWRPDQITVNSDDATYNAIWVAETSHAWATNYASSQSTLVSDDDTHYNAGYVMTDLYGYNSTGTPQFSATWVKESGSYYFDANVTVATFQSDDTTLRHQGYMLTRVSTFTDSNGVMKVAALWRPATVSAYVWAINQSTSGYLTNYNTYTSAGYTLAYTSMFSDGQINSIYTK